MEDATREIASVQRDSYEAFADNLAAAQRRGMGLAEGGLEFLKLQEENARATREWFAGGVRLLRLQQRNAEFARNWTNNAVGALREQAEHNVRTAETFTRVASRQQEEFAKLAERWVGAYGTFFNPLAYAQEGLKTVEKATEKTEEVLQETVEATREAEVRAEIQTALKTDDYDGLTVDEISGKLDGLSVAALRKLREHEKRNKNRETLIEQIDRRIKAHS